MIDDSQISVVVQGPLIKSDAPNTLGTEETIQRLRNDWPRCEIIFSTWKLERPLFLPVDQIVENEDPGAVSFNDTDLKGKSNNLNRQLVSTIAGLQVATRRYAIKLRSDCGLDGTLFLERMNSARYDYSSRLFCRRVLTLSFCTVDSTRIPLLYHPSDIFHFGDRRDLIKLWSVPLATEPEHTRWFESHTPPPTRWPGTHFLVRCSPEQYIWSEFLRAQHVHIEFDHTLSYSPKELLRSMELLIDGFIVAEPCEVGVRLPQHLVAGTSQMSTVIVSGQSWRSYDLLRYRRLVFRLRVLQRKYGLRWMLKSAFNPVKMVRRIRTLTSARWVASEGAQLPSSKPSV
jgi:hypothetical protein